MPSDPFANSGLHVMAKPIGPICNLDCEYCYYLESWYPSQLQTAAGMPPETMDNFVRQYIAAQPAKADEITFAWQGGEPTLLGVDYFRRVVEMQQAYQPIGKRIVNSLQTNGVLLDDEWCEFFAEHNFLIGLSIDGPAELHDKYRYDKKGEPTFTKVLNGLKLLKKHGVEYNALVVVNRHNGDHGRRVYTYLRDNGIEFLQFIPIVEKRGLGVHAESPTELPVLAEHAETSDETAKWDHLVSSRSVRPRQFGRFLSEVFDEWVIRDVGRVFVQIFDQALSAWVGVEPSLCVFRKECGRALAIEHNGDLFSCDHFVEPEYKLGNILDLPILDMANSDAQRKFGSDKQSSLPQYCRECEVRFMCNGECPKNRFIETPSGEAGLNYLCEGYRQFFNHIDPVMKMMADEVKQRRPAANVMHRLKATSRGTLANSQEVRRAPSHSPFAQRQAMNRPTPVGSPNAGKSAGRNDPCPCGSGKKFKKCCGK